MLGIIIGVAAVISLLSIGRGAQVAIVEQIRRLGTNLLFVTPGSITQGEIRLGVGSAPTLTLEDAEALANPLNAPTVAMVAPEFNGFGQVAYAGRNIDARVTGTTPEYQEVCNSRVRTGVFINRYHVEAKTKVAVLGSKVAEALFGSFNPLGQTIRINRVPFQVIGVMEAKGGTGFGSQDDVIFVPITTAQTRLFGGRSWGRQGNVSVINVQVVDERRIDEAVQQISYLLRWLHQASHDDGFTITSQKEMILASIQVTRIMTLFLASIGAISLTVGGIGIMNIMLASVTERTREIGIRKAVGAKRRDILAQFLIEAIVISTIGGILGILMGAGISRLFSGYSVAQLTPVETVVGIDSIVLAFLFSMGVGLFFGVYPAMRAASLNPIEALRYE